MVFTCDRPIREIKNMTERLVSRLSNGLCIDLEELISKKGIKIKFITKIIREY